MTRLFLSLIVSVTLFLHSADAVNLSTLKKDQKLAGLQVQNLYRDSDGRIVGAKFLQISTGAPVFLLQLQTVPQVITWVDTPTDSNQGLPHALEHLLVAKGTKGRYLQLLQQMRLNSSGAVTYGDFVAYGLSSGSGVDGFFESFHALLNAIYRPDFIDAEAATEFYHFGVSNIRGSKKTLIEQGTVYDEERAVQDRYTYVHELNKRVFGDQSPFAFNSAGDADEMRAVTPEQIRRFHDKYYRLGPSTGFIFAFPPEENVSAIVQKISNELQQFSQQAKASATSPISGPKYPVHASQDLTPGIFPFPGPNVAAPGFIHFAWQPGNANSQTQLKLLEIFAGALADGEDSLLQKVIVDSKTRLIDSGATGIDSWLFVENSPYHPALGIELAGVPGNRISAESINALRNMISTKIKEVSEYPDHSQSLLEFNRSVESYAKGLRRSERVWTKNAPGFGSHVPKTDWKWQFERLAMDSSFVQSISEEPVWQRVENQLRSGKNIWRDLIEEFHLAESPYATAAKPSPGRLEEIEKSKDERVRKEISTLMRKYDTDNEQEAISQYEREEALKTEEIDKIADSIPVPHFTKSPPLTPDEQLQYREFQIRGVPVTASFFDAPPTIDVGLSFDLRKVPRSYYKYLPLFVHCVDSLGLNGGGHVTSYSDLRAQIQRLTYAFSTGYESNPVSKRADFTIRASAVGVQDSQATLDLIQHLIEFNYLDVSNVDRLRDLVASDIAADDWYLRQDTSTLNAGYSFRYQNDPLFFALWSRPTRAHWSERLKWLLHQPVNATDINKLDSFAKDFLSLPVGASRKEVADKLDAVQATGLEEELVNYWRRNLSSFPEAELVAGLQQLTLEVREDLQTGPEKTIEALKKLQGIILNRRGLHVDLTLSRSELAQMEPNIAEFLKHVAPSEDLSAPEENKTTDPAGTFSPVMLNLRNRYQIASETPPLYVGFVNPNRLDGSVVSYTDFPGYSETDRESLVHLLASKLFSGTRSQGFFMKTTVSGLAYNNNIISDPRWKVIWYTANRVPDIAALIKLVNSTASAVADPKDPSIVDYTVSQVFWFSRAASTFSDRGKAMAQDLRDGNDPPTIRRFSEAVLSLSKEPGLSAEIATAALPSICGVLLREDCKAQQQAGNSLFFFMGSEKVLSDAEQAVPVPKLLWAWPSDYWIQ
jgi:Zn-dependent M16 (insulinase) family peptidase